MGERTPELDRLRRIVSPPGMKQRVLDRIERRTTRPRRRARWRLALIFIPATAVAAGAVHRMATRHDDRRPTDPQALERPSRLAEDVKRSRPAPPLPPPLLVPVAPPEPVVDHAPRRSTGPAVDHAARRSTGSRRRRPARGPAPPPVAAPVSDELSLQVAAYERALALRKRRPRQALHHLERMRRRWPRGALAHEVALRTVETLLQVGDRQEARQAARVFLSRFPESPRAPEIRAWIEKD